MKGGRLRPLFISGLNGAIVMTEKLSKKLYSTKLFDVKQDIIGALPLREHLRMQGRTKRGMNTDEV